MSTSNETTFPCVATTGDTFCKATEQDHLEESSQKRRKLDHYYGRSNHFSSAEFSNDGTTIITNNADQHLRTFVLPSDLLVESEQPHTLEAYRARPFPTAIQSYAIFPHFSLQNSSTTVFLTAAKDLPITLNNAIHKDFVHAIYPHINPTTEEYISPNTLLWTQNGSHFVAGSLNRLAIFDASYDGSEPVLTHKTGQGRREAKRIGSNDLQTSKGTINALSANRDGVLAAGTRERNIALYAHEGGGECITSFSLAAQKDYFYATDGTGVTQLAWSPDGTYLLVAERQSDGIQVFDVRNTHQRVAWLKGRKADTTQRLGIDVVPTETGYEVWAGGTDGCVRMWKDPGAVEGAREADEVVKLHSDPVASAIWHPSGTVLATCSGRRAKTRLHLDSSDDESEEEDRAFDNTLKIWTL